MRIFKTKWFNRWARSEKISDSMLKDAVNEIESGLHDGNLGAWLIKKRVARPGEGKRSGYRTLISFRVGQRSIFVFGFPKNERGNIKKPQEEIFKKLSKDFQGVTAKKINELLQQGHLIEVE